jgi:hypothetical protein
LSIGESGACKSKPTIFSDCPWDLLMVIPNASKLETGDDLIERVTVQYLE